MWLGWFVWACSELGAIVGLVNAIKELNELRKER